MANVVKKECRSLHRFVLKDKALHYDTKIYLVERKSYGASTCMELVIITDRLLYQSKTKLEGREASKNH